ncbi:winged helix-turn-helix transcriptional regulator [Chondromyces apiculatus]|nr:helix-turn-helix domain-containing protein [Chondromyces apiculatus]
MAPSKARHARAQSLAQRFYAGRYADIVREHIDGPHEAELSSDLPFLVGALAFVGRLEEARALFSGRRRRKDVPEGDPTLVAARFFLAVAYCRAGRLEEAKREVSLNLRAASRHGGPLSRFYVLQGMGCYRYFTGRLRQAARHALRALEYAFVAAFPYGRFLATDLRGHVLVQLGAVQEGLSLLETARTLAGALDLAGNATALDFALGIYRARFGVVQGREAIAMLNDLQARTRPDDSYSKRSLCIEMASQYALAGEGDVAWGLLERLGTEQLPDGGDVRARIRFLLACANVARLRYGAPSMAPFVSEARALVGAHEDIALELDVSCMEILATDDAEERARIEARLRALHRRSGISRVWLREGRAESSPPAQLGAEVLEEDRLGALYAACLRGSPELGSRVIATGHWGLLPLCLGFAPGRRLMLLDRRLVVEDHGNVTVVSDVSDGTRTFLRALGGGERHSKEDLLRLVWGIGAYRPDAHDPVIHTAVSRLRALLGVRGHWIEAVSGGYQLAAGVTLVELSSTLSCSKPAEVGATPERVPGADLQAAGEGAAPPPRATISPAPSDAQVPERDAIVALLAREGPASSTELATRLGVSEMTALRRLRQLVDQGVVRRSGKGKNTRYGIGSNADES